MGIVRRTLTLAGLLALVATSTAVADADLEFGVALQPRDPAGLDAFVEAVSTPGSPQFGQYLRRGEFAERFGPAPETVAQVSDALRAAGLEPGPLPANGMVLPVRGTAAELQAASATDDIAGVFELGPVAPARSALRAGQPAPAVARSSVPSRLTAPTPCADAVSGQAGFAAPIPWLHSQVAAAYDFTRVRGAGGWGTGRTIALMEFETYDVGGLQTFQDCYGTSVNVVTVNVATGAANPPASLPGTALQDIETVVALAPGASLLVYQAPGAANPTSDQWLGMFSLIAANDAADVVSTSWGRCEAVTSPDFLTIETYLLAQMAAQGQTVIANSGDVGAEDCNGDTKLDVGDPAAHPAVLSVGGTSMTAVGDPPAQRPTETAWNNSYGSGGGGISALQRMPAWQRGPGVIGPLSTGLPCFSTSGYCRQVPDVSAFADSAQGYLFYDHHNGWDPTGGTGSAAAVWAALTASIQSVPQCGARRFGRLAERLYPLAGPASAAFNDVVIGNNDQTGSDPTRYGAGPGYDMATGLGTPVGGGLLAGLCPAASGGGGGAAPVERVPERTETPAPTPVPVAPAPAPAAPTVAEPAAAPAPRAQVSDAAVPAMPDGRFSLGVACPAGGASCRLDVRVSGSGLDLRLRNRRVEAGEERALPLRLPARLRGRRVALTVTITSRTADGRTTTSSRRIVVRARGRN